MSTVVCAGVFIPGVIFHPIFTQDRMGLRLGVDRGLRLLDTRLHESAVNVPLLALQQRIVNHLARPFARLHAAADRHVAHAQAVSRFLNRHQFVHAHFSYSSHVCTTALIIAHF